MSSLETMGRALRPAVVTTVATSPVLRLLHPPTDATESAAHGA